MISYIKGMLKEINLEEIVVENNSMGYDIRVPTSVISGLPAIGSDVKVYTYMYVREDILCLYGFLSRDDLAVFKLLIGVNGIGPKGALGILSTINPDDLRFAVLSDDVKTISKAPGIGTKTAQKLIIELRDKLKLSPSSEKKSENIDTGFMKSNTINDTVQALVALGYSNAEALKAISKVQITEEMTTEDVLKLSLKKIM